MEVQNELCSESIVQSWYGDSSNLLTGGSTVAVTKIFFEINVKM
jgi:hypothetical protein